MNFIWTLPGRLPDEAAITRMKQHFQEPAEPMPEAWFMGEINYFTWLMGANPAEFEASDLRLALHEAFGGIRSFPRVRFVPVWRAWIPYLLPYALGHGTEYSEGEELFFEIIETLLNIYPNEIIEEYPGFRNDIIHAICARSLPHILARNIPSELDREHMLIVTDIWDNSNFFSDETDQTLSLPLWFCLKYLPSTEIEAWATSVLGIESVQFHWEFICWWLAFNKFLTLAQEWPQEQEWPNEGSKVRDMLKEAGLYSPFFLPAYPTFNNFIPAANLAVFKSCLADQLTFDVFQQWAVDIKANADYYLPMVEPVLQRFENEFFGQ